MKDKTDPKRNPGKPENAREDRLKAALKANLQRRKAQARARKAIDKTDKDE
ncbi:hypothetical protein [Celeribacter halophilus]|uniref:hypothetical protein n=1 Tax=Celeribacter halophilus TaxID=576117 RepID=UPI000A4A710F|nr:hypothetical protein [Celeribacter halophilus]